MASEDTKKTESAASDEANIPADKADRAPDKPAGKPADKAGKPDKAPDKAAGKAAGRASSEPADKGQAASPPPTFSVASSPHVHSGESTSRIMWTVFATLLPATIFAGYQWGMDAVVVLTTCTGGAVVFEAIAQWAMGRDLSVRDGSAALTGLLLGLTMPPGAPVMVSLVGVFVAVVVGKAVFGGLGHNPFNPALTGRVFILIAFPGSMTRWPVPLSDLSNRVQSLYGQATTWLDATGKVLPHAQAKGASALAEMATKVDAITAATPLALVKEHWQKGTGAVMQYSDFFLGTQGGSLGEVSALLLLAGAAVLLWRRIITWHIPVSFLLGVIVMATVTHLVNPNRYMGPLFHLLTGGVIIGAFFMATDYVTSPTYPVGMVLFGLGCGVLTMVIRLWGGFPEGVSFAILIMNALTPLLERYTRPKKFGLKPWTEPEAAA